MIGGDDDHRVVEQAAPFEPGPEVVEPGVELAHPGMIERIDGVALVGFELDAALVDFSQSSERREACVPCWLIAFTDRWQHGLPVRLVRG